MSHGQAKPSLFRQPRAVWAVAFACVISFMGIGLVDPILPALSKQLDATPAQVSLLFTSYLVVTAVAMLVTNWVSSRIGAKRTLMAGLVLIVAFAALAGTADSISGIVGFRAGWGLGNALFIATSLAVIVASASGGFEGAIILYETALGLGIAVGPLLGRLPRQHQLARPVLRRERSDGDRAHRDHGPGAADAEAGPQDVPGRAAQSVAPPRFAHHEPHRAVLQLGLLHASRLRALPDEARPDPARSRLYRLGRPRRTVQRRRRATAAPPFRNGPDVVRQPGDARASCWP